MHLQLSISDLTGELMDQVTVIFIILAIVIGFYYMIMILRFTLSFLMYQNPGKEIEIKNSVRVSVIVAVRNEQDQIEECLHKLLAQDYEHDHLEIIISDDFSSDQTINIVNSFIESRRSANIKTILVTPEKGAPQGKKAALERAIEMATCEIIITTDADCTMKPGWVSSFVSVFLNSAAKMIVGFVNIQDTHSLFSKFQAMEFMSLAGTGAASVIQNKPLMCNGANIAFKRDAFYQFGGYSYGKESPTGDDTYLMLQMASENKANVVFNKDPNSTVTTQPLSTIGDFVNQRIRWASKVKYYRERYIKRTGVFLFLVNLTLLLLLTGSVLDYIPYIITGVLWLAKMAVDFIFLYHISAFSRQQHLLLLFLPTQLIYPFYSLVATILSLTKVRYNWKERNY